jgi:fructose-bisphosphate aldolase, class I
MSIDTSKLQSILDKICQPGRGILAADESTGTIKKRLDSINTENTEDNRRTYRNMLFTTNEYEQYVSGVILFDETVDQAGEEGTIFSQMIANKNVVPGIKSDAGKAEHPTHTPQTLTHGLDDLKERLANWTQRSNGTLGFTKWRQVILVEPNPTQDFLDEAMDVLAKNALLSQEAGYVPITEPEVLMDGSHTLEQCADVTERTLKTLYKKLEENGVSVPHTLLKPNMVLSGKGLKKDTPQEVAQATLTVFRSALPTDLPGVVFLSGGQSPEQATANLNAINVLAKELGLDGLPAVDSAQQSEGWWISFSYGRALQEYALKAWAGAPENITAAQEAFLKRARLNGLAQKGEYNEVMEKEEVSVG